jgi:hypothetical protein
MGRLAATGDWRSIGAALVEVIAHREQYIKPRETIERIFSFKETVDSYERILRQYARPRHD